MYTHIHRHTSLWESSINLIKIQEKRLKYLCAYLWVLQRDVTNLSTAFLIDVPNESTRGFICSKTGINLGSWELPLSMFTYVYICYHEMTCLQYVQEDMPQ